MQNTAARNAIRQATTVRPSRDCSYTNAKTDATSNMRRDGQRENVTFLKKIALHIALACVVALVCCANDEIVCSNRFSVSYALY